MVDENDEIKNVLGAENPLMWLIMVALKIGVARLMEFILDALDL